MCGGGGEIYNGGSYCHPNSEEEISQSCITFTIYTVYNNYAICVFYLHCIVL